MTLADPVVLDLSGVADKAAFMERCASALDLPGWFGRNWDALADSLTDLPRGTVVVVEGWQDYAAGRPDEWEVAQEVLESAVLPGALDVLLRLGGSHQHPDRSPG
ncbi:barstar family protein [Streptomyces sp. NPDC001941]|uniref:barstar family protein n=1 Tax=Streptomyces sp. NPDC001941 TaxID=3154659 RepID=UPI00331B0702